MADELAAAGGGRRRPTLRKIKNRMMVIPNIIDPSVPIGKDDSRER